MNIGIAGTGRMGSSIAARRIGHAARAGLWRH